MDSFPDPPERVRARLVRGVWLLALLAVVGAGVALRLPLLHLGFTSDEIVNATDGGFGAIFTDPETAVNPPGLRWLVNLPFDPWDAARFGRRFALGCSVASIGLAFVVGRRASSGSALGGLVAAALLAFHPYTVHDAAQLRAYAWFSATALLHVLAMGAAQDGGRGRRAWLALATATAVLLPWIHYFAIPVLLALGTSVLLGARGHRRDFAVYVAAGVGFLPLVPAVLGASSQRVTTPDHESVAALLVRLASLELRVRGPVGGPLGALAEAVAGAPVDPGALMAGAVFGLAGVGLLRGGRMPATGRLALAGLLGVLGGAVAFSRVQYVRPATLSLVVTFAGPALVGAVAAALPRGRAVGLVALAVLLGADLPERFRADARAWTADGAPPWLGSHHAEVVARAGGRPIVVLPRAALWSVWFQLTHQVPYKAPHGAHCDGQDACLALEGVTWVGRDTLGPVGSAGAVVVSMDPWRTPGPPPGCTAVEDRDAWGIFDCPPAGATP